MKKTTMTMVLAILLVCSLTLFGCSFGLKTDETLDKNFAIDTTTREVNFGDPFMIEPVSAKNEEGAWYDATIKLTKPDGTIIPIEAGEMTFDAIGTYTITYEIAREGYEVLTRSYTVIVKDMSAPEISGISADNLVMLGQIIDLNAYEVIDKVDGKIEHTVTVTFGGEEVAVNDGKFVADKEGCYVINVTGTDKAGNAMNETVNVFTVMDYEQDILQTNEFYGIELSDKYSYHGGKSARMHWFDSNVNWLNDYCLLGSKTAFGSDAQYLSFWVYFDGASTDLNKLVLQTKYTYFDTYVFGEYGEPLGYYWNFVLGENAPAELKEMYAATGGQFTYEMEVNKWYRIVIDLTKMTNASKYGQTADGFPIDGPLTLEGGKPGSFAELAFGFGMWDHAIGGQPTKVVDVYVDDIRLTNELNDEEYNEEIKVNITSETSAIKNVGDTFDITATVTPEGSGAVTYTSTNPEVATVDENGKVTCIAEGQAAIVVTSVKDPRKSANVNVTVAVAGDPIRDELNMVIYSGGKSIGSWETEGKYNMIEHMIWASNEYENGVSNNCPLVSMSIAHGTVDSYKPLQFVDGNFTGGEGSPVAIYGGWQAFVGGTDGLVFAFTAKQDISIKTTGDTVENRLGGWVSDTLWQWVKIKADGTQEELYSFKNPEFANVESDWFEIAEGETFVLLVRSNGDADTRNFELLPFFYICPMI